MNAVFTVNWKCCWSARLGYVGNAAGLHGFSKVTTSISSSSVTVERGGKKFFFNDRLNYTIRYIGGDCDGEIEIVYVIV